MMYLINKLDLSQLTNCSFNAAIWGTVSDWAMILVTAITAYFLWKTLKSQKDIQKLQTDLNELQFKQHRKNIMPYFIIHNERRSSPSSHMNFKTIRVNGANAHNIQISNKYNNLEVKEFIPFAAVETNLNVEFIATSSRGGNGYITSSYSLGDINNKTGEREKMDLLSIIYEDSELNPYMQILYYEDGKLLFTAAKSRSANGSDY